MKIAILGATGFVGLSIVNDALERGHIVTAIARHVDKLPQRDRLIARADRLIVNVNGESKISVSDFVVGMIDELENPSHARQSSPSDINCTKIPRRSRDAEAGEK